MLTTYKPAASRGGTAWELASHLHALQASALPPSTREAAIRCVLDVLCAAAAGLDDPGVRAGREAAIALYGTGMADIWFAGACASPSAALLANALAASALDLDDGNRLARGHPGAAAISAAWAALATSHERVGADEFLDAVVAGYEAGVRMAMGRLSYAPSGAWSPYAAIAAAGKIEGASPEVMAQAFAIAAQTAPGLPGLAGLMSSDVKEGIAWGSVTGLAALQLARSGFSGPAQIFDDPALFAAFRIRDDFGGPALIEQTYFKPYACCRHIHAALDAYLELAARHGFEARAVAAIEVHTYRATFNLANLAEPGTLVEAQYSVPYCLALCAIHGSDALLPMRTARLADRDVHGLARRITVRHDPQLDALFPVRSPARIVVRLATGAQLESPLTDPRGDPGRPLSWAELEAKFLTATAASLPAASQRTMLVAIERLRGGDLQPLRAALRSPARPCSP